MGILSDYKKTWANGQVKESDHPLDFWLRVIDMAVEGRRVLQADQLNPLGKRPDQKHWQDYLAIVLQTGIDLEKNKGMDAAFVMYEICVTEAFHGSHPYDRLRIWYTANKKYKDAIRVCQAYIDLPDRPHGQAKDRFRHFREKLSYALDRLEPQSYNEP